MKQQSQFWPSRMFLGVMAVPDNRVQIVESLLLGQLNASRLAMS